MKLHDVNDKVNANVSLCVLFDGLVRSALDDSVGNNQPGLERHKEDFGMWETNGFDSWLFRLLRKKREYM